MPDPGDIVLARVRFTDADEEKKRPALVLYTEYGNIIVAGITSNTRMGGIELSVADGAIKPSVIKLNYLFTIADHAIDKHLFTLSREKRSLVRAALMERLEGL